MFTRINERAKTISPIIPKMERVSFKKATPNKSGSIVEKEEIKAVRLIGPHAKAWYPPNILKQEVIAKILAYISV